MLKIALWTILALSFGSVARAAPPADGQAAEAAEDPLSLAALLLADGNVDRAGLVLDGVSPEAPGLDAARYWSLIGLVTLQQGDNARAEASFGRSIALTLAACEADPAQARPCAAAVDPVLYLSQARARLLLGDAAGAMAALNQGGDALNAFSGAFLVRARAAEALGDPDGAWAALAQGAARFPALRELPRQQVLLLLRLGLRREASAAAARLLDREDVGLDDIIAIAEAMRKAGSLEGAAALLEDARLQYPGSVEPLLRLAAVHMDAGRPRTAARFLQEAAEWDIAWALASAELYRKAGDIDAALYMNSRVADPIDKVRQRFGLLLDDGAFERAVALDERLGRLGLLRDDEALRYGLAYAHFRVGGLDRAEALLAGFADPRIYEDALALRQAIARCKAAPESCG